MNAVMSVMVSAVRKAARPLLRDFGELQALQGAKGDTCDAFARRSRERVRRILCEELERTHPGYGIFLKPGPDREGSDKTACWRGCALDGLENFTRGRSTFSVSLALERDGVLVCGVVYEPVQDDLFTAERGIGARVNDRRIRAGPCAHLGQAIVASDMENVSGFHECVGGIRRTGAASLDLVYTAAGRFDGCLLLHAGLPETAAGIIVAREAGVMVSAAPQGGILATNSVLHDALCQAAGRAAAA